MKKTIPSFFKYASVVLVIITIILLGYLISANNNRLSPAVTPSSPPSTPISATSVESSASSTPELPVTKTDSSGVDANIFLALVVAMSAVGILFLFRMMQVNSRGFASLSENLKKIEEKQTASFQVGKLLQKNDNELIEGLTKIKDANSQALKENISLLLDEISELKNQRSISQTPQHPTDDASNKALNENISRLRDEISELKNRGSVNQTFQPQIGDANSKALNENISMLRNEISELKNRGYGSQALQPQLDDASNKVLNENISMLRDEISELKRQGLSVQPPVPLNGFMPQLREIISKLVRENSRDDSIPSTPPDVLKSKIIAGIYERELEKIKGLVLEYPNLETGGDLFGFWTHSGAPVIQFVLGPGANSTHAVTSFYQDEEFLKANGEFLNQMHGFQHIGEWHSHHQMSLKHPSGGDESTIRSALSNYGFQRFLLCIANIGRDGSVSVQPYLFEAESSTYKAGKWNVFSGDSPFRSLEVEMPGSNIDNKKSYRNKKVSSTESIQVKSVLPQAWYATNEGNIFLKGLDASLKTTFDECKIKIKQSGQLYFSVKSNKLRAQIFFPDDFPRSEPSVLIGEETYTVPLKSGINKTDKLFRWVYDQFVKIVQEVES